MNARISSRRNRTHLPSLTLAIMGLRLPFECCRTQAVDILSIPATSPTVRSTSGSKCLGAVGPDASSSGVRLGVIISAALAASKPGCRTWARRVPSHRAAAAESQSTSARKAREPEGREPETHRGPGRTGAPNRKRSPLALHPVASPMPRVARSIQPRFCWREESSLGAFCRWFRPPRRKRPGPRRVAQH
jgi:hypothetical protein